MSGFNSDQVKAFKKAMGVKPDSTDWKKIIQKMNAKLPELQHYVDLLQQVGSPLHNQANTELANLQQTATTARQAYQVDPKVGGRMARDSVLIPLRDAIETYRKGSKSTPTQVQINDPVTNNPINVDVFWTDIPGFEEMSQVNRTAALQTVATKVQRGKTLYNDIQNGNPPNHAATGRDVTDLVWAMKTGAQSQAGEPFEKGAVTMPNGVALRAFLDSCPDVYNRASSHLVEQQGLPGQGPRGVDFYGGVGTMGGGGDGLLPAGMNTLLYQVVTPSTGPQRLYVKMETEGAPGSQRLSSGKNDPTAPPNRPAQDGDFGHLMKHTFNFLAPKTQSDKDLGAFREDAPKEIKTAAKAFVKQVQAKPIKTRLAAAMAKKFRVGTFLQAVLTELNNNTLPENPPASGFINACNTFMNLIANTYGGVATALIASGEEINVTANQL